MVLKSGCFTLAGLPGIRVLEQRYEQLPAHDCFVTAGNAYGVMTAGIDAAIIARFGAELMREVQEHIMERYLGEQPVGSAFILPRTDEACRSIAQDFEDALVDRVDLELKQDPLCGSPRRPSITTIPPSERSGRT